MRGIGLVLVASVVFAAMVLSPPPLTAALDDASKAELDARRLKGRASYENGDYEEAVAEFQRCVSLAPDAAVDYLNLGLVLMRARRHEEALRALSEAQDRDPSLLAVHYLRGIIFKREGRFDEAIESLSHVVSEDPECRGAYYNLGVAYKAKKQYGKAIEAFKTKVALSRDDPSTHYQLISVYRRTGDVEEAERHTEIFLRVKDTVDESEKTEEALERSKYTDILEVPRLTGDLPSRRAGGVRFVDVTEQWGLAAGGAPVDASQRDSGPPPDGKTDIRTLAKRFIPRMAGGVAVADYDGDGDLDLYLVNGSPDRARSANRLLQNQGGGSFADQSVRSGVADRGIGLDAAFGDYDNDGLIDLYVANWGRNALYHNLGDGRFENVSEAAGVDEPQCGRKALFVDYDHDNDLDLFIANDVELVPPGETSKTMRFPEDFSGQANTMLRNQGDGTFSDQTDEAGLLTHFAQTQDVVAGDLDGDHDVDLFVVNADAPAHYFANARFGRFEPGGAFSPPVPSRSRAVAAGDFNRDGRTDLVIAAGRALVLYVNEGEASFSGTPIPSPSGIAEDGVGRIEVWDFNNDGWSDLFLTGAGGSALGLLAGAGRNAFVDVTSATGLDGAFGEIAGAATGDLDGDGDEEIILQTRDRGPVVLRNDGVQARHWIGVRLIGKKVNRSGYGATVEIASGGHYQKRTYFRGPVHFGLGDLEKIDVVRVTWPNGVAQNVIQPEIDRELAVEEQVKVSASCGFLFAFNGRGFELVNEILGVGPLGVPMAAGVFHQPDSTELTKIESHQLVAVDGIYDLRLTEELRETMYADQITLRVVDHPPEQEIIPNEMFSAPPFPEDRLFAVTERRPPVAAVDDRGADVLDLVLERDGRFPEFPRTPYAGLARPHALILDLGDLSSARTIRLYLDGWIHWAESSTVMAITQDPRFELTPLSLEVRDEGGRWRTAIESVGLPTSKGLVVPVDLTGRFPTTDYRVRLSTTMSVYFDRVFVSTDEEQIAPLRVTELPVDRADLHFRGFSAMTRDGSGYERFNYDHTTPTGSWNPPAGLFTRYGDVTPLLAHADDMYVIFGPGDELSLRFDASGLPALPANWTRDFVFFADGWVKDGDLNTKFSETVAPLPFHGMSGYPYPASERYPETPEIREYLRTYNTRPGRVTVGALPTESD